MHAECHYAGCRFTKCRYSEYWNAKLINVILSTNTLIIVILSAVVLDFNMLNVIMPSVVMLNVNMLNVTMPTVVMLNVMAPFNSSYIREGWGNYLSLSLSLTSVCERVRIRVWVCAGVRERECVCVADIVRDQVSNCRNKRRWHYLMNNLRTCLLLWPNLMFIKFSFQ
jgi:hypothetical protein